MKRSLFTFRTGRPEQRRRRQQGFTLIEMLAVVLILVIVAGIGFVVVNNQIEKSRERTDVANVRTIADAVQRYMIENTSAPTGQVTANHPLIKDGFLAAPPQDPWGKNNLYNITSDGKNITITGVKASNPPQVTLNEAVPSGGGSGG